MKLAKTISLKGLGTGKVLGDDQLSGINKYALVPLTVEQVHVRKYLMAHNFIDRDNERFSEQLLDNFAATLPGKGFFVEGHPSGWSGKGGPGEGRFFDALVEEMTPDLFQQLTGETPKMPQGVETIKVLWGWAYILKLDSNADTVAKIDGGIYSFTSIGFKAPYFDVTDERGNVIYGEYRPNGEALEGSLVWLGAQPGAGAMKAAQSAEQRAETEKTNTGGRMKEFIKKLGERMKKTFTEENAVEEIAALVSEKDTEIAALRVKAVDGEAYRKSLVEDVVRFGALVGEIPTDETGQKTEVEFISTWPIQRIKDLKDRYELKARKQFPDQFSISSKDETDRQKAAEEAAKKSAVPQKKKDYTDPAQNELLAVK